MIRQLREGCYRVVSYLQRIKKLVKKGQETGGLQELTMKAASPQCLESEIVKGRAEIKEVKRAERKRARKVKGSSTKKKRAKRSKKRRTRKSRR